MRDIISVRNVTGLKQIAQVSVGWITQVAWSPDNRSLAVACADGVQLFVEEFGSKPTHLLTGHEGPVKAIAFSPNSKLLASVSSDTTIKLWDVSSPRDVIREITTIEGHQDSVETVAFSPDGNTLATGCADGTIFLWDVDTYTRKAVLESHQAEVTSLIFALQGNVIVSGGRDSYIFLFDVSAETHGTQLGEHNDWIRQVQSNPAGTMVASAGKDGFIRLWDTFTTELYSTIAAHPEGADSVAFSPDGTLLVTGGRDNLIRVWYVQKAVGDGEADMDDALVVLQSHSKPILSLAFNPAGTLLATASGDNTVRVWSAGAAGGEDDRAYSKTTTLETDIVYSD